MGPGKLHDILFQTASLCKLFNQGLGVLKLCESIYLPWPFFTIARLPSARKCEFYIWHWLWSLINFYFLCEILFHWLFGMYACTILKSVPNKRISIWGSTVLVFHLQMTNNVHWEVNHFISFAGMLSTQYVQSMKPNQIIINSYQLQNFIGIPEAE